MPTESDHPDLTGLRSPVLVLVLLLALALALRIISALNDFWLDEIWSFQAVEQLHSASEVLTRFRHDNNHPLNSWLLYLLRGHQGFRAYRIPLCFAGTATVAVAWWLGARRDRLTAFTSAFVFALSFFLIHYSSEARGYGYVQLFTLTTVALAIRFLESPRAINAALIFLSVVLGFLAHLTFLYAFAGVAVFVTLQLWKTRDSLRAAFAQACAALLPGSIFALLYGWFFTRGMEFGGGPPVGKGEVLLKTLGWVLLGGAAKAQLWGALLIFLLLTTWASIEWWRARNLEGVLFGVSMIAAPLALLLTSHKNFFAPRYFSVPAVFLLLLLARLLASLLARPGALRRAGVAACALFIVVNALPLRKLWQHGRGSYLEMLNGICAADPGPEITIGSGQDFRYPKVLDFYARYATHCGRLVYLPRQATEQPRWILYSFYGAAVPPPETKLPYAAVLPPGAKLLLRAFYPSGSELSGWGVGVYERVQ
jgi:hypothetical protein